jgi:hypothetical protein
MNRVVYLSDYFRKCMGIGHVVIFGGPMVSLHAMIYLISSVVHADSLSTYLVSFNVFKG